MTKGSQPYTQGACQQDWGAVWTPTWLLPTLRCPEASPFQRSGHSACLGREPYRLSGASGVVLVGNLGPVLALLQATASLLEAV